jgi:O-antigen/teichoic acid export membrane protein
VQLSKLLTWLFLGRASVALALFILIPIYLSYLGSEALGLFLLVPTAVALAMVFDFGVSTDCARAAAQLSNPESRNTCLNKLRFGQKHQIISATSVAAMLMVLAVLTPNTWTKALATMTSYLMLATMVLALWAACTLIQNFYVNVLPSMGFAAQTGLILALGSFVRMVSVLAILHAGGGFLTVASVQLLVIITQTLLMTTLYQRAINKIQPTAGDQDSASISYKNMLNKDLVIISSIAALVTQFDRFILASQVSVEKFAFYAAAATVAAGMYLVINPLISAAAIRLANSFSLNGKDQFEKEYIMLTELAVLLFLPLTASLVFNSDLLLQYWLPQAKKYEDSSLILMLLLVATMINAYIHLCYTAQVAVNRTDIARNANILVLLAYVPALYLAVEYAGTLGAAIAWFLLNCILFIFWPGIAHKKMMSNYFSRWTISSIALPCICVFFAAWIFVEIWPGNKNSDYFLLHISRLPATFILCLIITLLFLPILRKKLRRENFLNLVN